MSRLVLCAGIPRSGSTWLFNAARLLLERRGPVTSGWIEDVGRSPDPDATTLIKLHGFDERLATRADVVLTSRRDLVEIAASAVRLGWISDRGAADFIDGVVAQHAAWAAYASYELAYERLRGGAAGVVGEVGAALGVEVDPRDAAEIGERIDRFSYTGASGTYDPVTLLHPRHTAPVPYRLSSETERASHIRFRDWLAAHGYARSTEHA
jgi:hypothetical protein